MFIHIVVFTDDNLLTIPINWIYVLVDSNWNKYDYTDILLYRY